MWKIISAVYTGKQKMNEEQLKQKQKSGFWNNFKIGLRLQG